MIPRIVHRIWLGDRSLPRRYARFIEQFSVHNRGWESILWTEEMIRPWIDFDSVPGGYGCQTNVIRLHLLRKYGGIYLDTDVEPIRPILPLIHGVDAFCGIEDEKSGLINNGVLGATPGHPWIERLIETLPQWWTRPRPWGPSHVTDITREFTDVKVFPQKVFSPFLPWKSDRPIPATADPKTVLLHHYDVTWETENGRHDAMLM